jgi:serine/threonine protein phosphatase PrpC
VGTAHLFARQGKPILLDVLRAYGVSDKGRIRTSNEDWFAVDERLQFCVVADGMGGHNAGEIAARLAVNTLLDSIREHFVTKQFDSQAPADRTGDSWPFGFDPSLSEAGNRIRTAVHLANAQILEASMATDSYAGMGTTLVAALISGNRLSVGHVGDSRLYLLANRSLRPLTLDDSWTATATTHDPGSGPLIARHYPSRSALTNVVGAPSTVVHLTEETLTGGEVLLLSTDGVHGVLDDRWLERLLNRTNDLQDMARGVVDAAMARGSRDNCTAVVARYAPDAGQKASD